MAAVSEAVADGEIRDPASFSTADPRSSTFIRDNHFERAAGDGGGAEGDSGGDEAEAFEPRVVQYMLFTKEPSRVEDKKLKQEKLTIMALESSEEQQMRDHITLLLREVEPLARVGRQNMNDPNSLSEIMSVIRQHTEKKKAFGDQDFINKILQNSIA